MATAYPTALDTTGSQQRTDIASTDDLDASGKEHDVMHVNHAGAIVALETKLGLTDSNAAANAILVGSGASTTSWTTSPSITNLTVTGTTTTYVDVVTETGASHTFALSDAGKYIHCTGAAGAVTITLPSDSTTAFPIGTQMLFSCVHASNQITFAAGSGAAINSLDDNLSLKGPDGVAAVLKYTTNTWLLFGALE